MAVIQLNEAQFKKIITAENSSAVIEFYASWCKPCHKMMPVIEELSEKYKDVRFYKIDADEEVLIAAALKVATLPTVVFAKDGVVKDVAVGNVPKEEIIKGIELLRT